MACYSYMSDFGCACEVCSTRIEIDATVVLTTYYFTGEQSRRGDDQETTRYPHTQQQVVSSRPPPRPAPPQPGLASSPRTLTKTLLGLRSARQHQREVGRGRGGGGARSDQSLLGRPGGAVQTMAWHGMYQQHGMACSSSMADDRDPKSHQV